MLLEYFVVAGTLVIGVPCHCRYFCTLVYYIIAGNTGHWSTLSLQVLLVIGGQAPKAIRSVECFDFKEEKWAQVADMPSRRCRCGKCQLVQSGYVDL